MQCWVVWKFAVEPFEVHPPYFPSTFLLTALVSGSSVPTCPHGYLWVVVSMWVPLIFGGPTNLHARVPDSEVAWKIWRGQTSAQENLGKIPALPIRPGFLFSSMKVSPWIMRMVTCISKLWAPSELCVFEWRLKRLPGCSILGKVVTHLGVMAQAVCGAQSPRI